MADTLLQVVNEVLRSTQQRQQTSFSDTNDTNFLVDRVNDGLQKVYNLKPNPIDLDGSITILPSVRVFNGPSGLDLSRIYDWSFRIADTAGDIQVNAVTREYIVTRFPLYESQEAPIPQYVYIEGNDLAVYPLLEAGANPLQLKFSYPAQLTKLTTTTATFPFEDRSPEMSFIKLFAKYKYEIFKGLGVPEDTRSEMEDVWAVVVAKYARLKRQGFQGYRQYGARRSYGF